MKENKYDDEAFFSQYSKMSRSVHGLAAAGEWHELEKLLPDFAGKTVLDLGCGFGWHCKYAVDKGATAVVGVDLSEKMLAEAQIRNNDSRITYLRQAIEEIEFADSSFDVILSSLAFHYIESFDTLCKRLYRILKAQGDLVFSVEHPIFTAEGTQNWFVDEHGNKLHWPVDHYFSEGKRETIFLGQPVIKYHRTITTYLNCLINNSFSIRQVVEPLPPEAMMRERESMREELRRPMMLLLAAYKA